MKRIIISFFLVLTLMLVGSLALPKDANAVQIPTKCEGRDACITAINSINRANLTREEFEPWIALQVHIPYPGCSDETNKEVYCSGNNLIAVKSLGFFVVAMFQFATIFIAIILTGMLVVAGTMYITSGGNPARAQKAMDYIKNSFISLVVLAFSVVILYQINPALISLKFTEDITDIAGRDLQRLCPDSPEFGCGQEYGAAGEGEFGCVGTSCAIDKKLPDGSMGPGLAKYCGEPEVKKAEDGTRAERRFECLSRKRAFQDCTNDNECWSGICHNSKCSDFSLAGASCGGELFEQCINNGFICEQNGINSCSYGKAGADCASSRDCSEGYVCVFEGVNTCVPKNSPYPWSRCASQSDCPSGTKCIEAPYDTFFKYSFTDADIAVCVPGGDELSKVCLTDNNCNNPQRPKCFTGVAKAGDITGAEPFCTTGKLGSPCTKTGECADGFFCSRTAIAGVDIKSVGVCSYGQLGDSCISGADCAKGYECSAGINDSLAPKFCNLGR